MQSVHVFPDIAKVANLRWYGKVVVVRKVCVT